MTDLRKTKENPPEVFQTILYRADTNQHDPVRFIGR